MKEMCASIGKMHEFLMVLKKAGFDSELIQEIINSKQNGLAKKMYEAVTQPIIQPSSDGVVYDFVVDYNQTVEQMVAACKFNFTHGAVNSHYFPILDNKQGRKEKISIKLLHFGRRMSYDDAVIKVELAGLYLATAHEALAFAKYNPSLPKEFSILALGSLCPFGLLDEYFLALSGSDSYRNDHGRNFYRSASILNTDGGVGESCRILTVVDRVPIS